MRREQRTRRAARARQFGARHPRPTLVLVGAVLAGGMVLSGLQLHHGTYLGHAWVVAAAAGMATAAVLAATIVIDRRRHRSWPRGFIAWLVLTGASSSALRYPFPRGRYGEVQAFFNALHAALLGYALVASASLVALLAYLLLHPRRARDGTAGSVHPPVPPGS